MSERRCECVLFIPSGALVPGVTREWIDREVASPTCSHCHGAGVVREAETEAECYGVGE